MPPVVGGGPGWDPLPVQYADYTLWQREQLGELDDPDSLIAAQVAFWEHELAGCPSGWSCPPIGRIRRWPIIAGRGCPWSGRRRCSSRLPGGREHNATSFMVMQAALAVLLSKLAASAEVAIGFPIAGRRDPVLDELVGFFVNTLVLRVDLAGNPSIEEVLARCARAAWPPTSTRMCRLSCWWSGSTRLGAWPITRWCR
ncbi:condensation domain protein [Mycobacterium xenopi 4042]|uniref:Condensation domain protein n=1 Tax=Mycobacterium xenopi 4042 TaxID=1299334 RepID=X8AM77_MYCXE|nr:condensation domain protein [Mycobacterium xenopi 4042]